MIATRSARTLHGRLVVGLILTLLLLSCGGPARAWMEEPAPEASQPPMTVAADEGPAAWELADCLLTAQQRQPRIAAQQSSLAAAEDGCRAMDALRFAAVVDLEIPVRRRQAALGVAAASAGVEQAERETAYSVTRTYFTVAYAREQERVAKAVVDRLTAIHQSADRQLKAGARDIAAPDVSRSKVYLQLAKTKQIQAAQGVKRALAALREAMNLPGDAMPEIVSMRLPEFNAKIVREDVVNGALARRPELVRVSLLAEITCLEVEAQGSCVLNKMQTFAAAADIHGVQVPQGLQNGEYRPAAVPPEMPTMLAGSRPERIRHAQSLFGRAQAVVEVTRNLITLEAEDAFLRWEEASQALAEAKIAADAGDGLADDMTKDFTAGAKVRVEDVVNARVLASQARAQYNELLYRQILALADIERITAGGICTNWAAQAPQDRPKDAGK